MNGAMCHPGSIDTETRNWPLMVRWIVGTWHAGLWAAKPLEVMCQRFCLWQKFNQHLIISSCFSSKNYQQLFLEAVTLRYLVFVPCICKVFCILCSDAQHPQCDWSSEYRTHTVSLELVVEFVESISSLWPCRTTGEPETTDWAAVMKGLNRPVFKCPGLESDCWPEFFILLLALQAIYISSD